MHLYMVTRGIKHEVDRFVEHMQCQYFDYNYNGTPTKIQLQMRPMQLWEVVFPKDCLDEVLTLVGNETPKGFIADATMLALRTTLGAKALPKEFKKFTNKIVYKQNMAVYPIGIKSDAEIPAPGHEAL